ncbi:hypothetical protein [Phragmitibacter flavus]|uniref:hypothetical protein n=1 Tax=Phragmitibacter flavus TaxID=2576071 RepID=UPI0019813375|nr:hypothetical protein [Phragmitibacter flavus]
MPGVVCPIQGKVQHLGLANVNHHERIARVADEYAAIRWLGEQGDLVDGSNEDMPLELFIEALLEVGAPQDADYLVDVRRILDGDAPPLTHEQRIRRIQERGDAWHVQTEALREAQTERENVRLLALLYVSDHASYFDITSKRPAISEVHNK